jgi:hypothetical protein
MFNNGGHVNYALPAYCVEIGHVNCLKKISKEPKFTFHYDLPILAIENDDLEILKFILEDLVHKMKRCYKDECLNFFIDNIKDMEIGPNCKLYVQNFLC